MIAIRTRYHGPTDTKGARISATDGRHRVSVPYPHELSGATAHVVAAVALCRKLGWKHERLVGGQFFESDYFWTFRQD